jgi:hypothetical protein
MSRIERVLHDEELGIVTGGVQDSETVAIQDSEKPGEIWGFKQQADPSGARRLGL